MKSFESQLVALTESTESLCAKADSVVFDGEGWTPAIILGHIVDVDKEVWLARFNMMVAALESGQEPPQLAWWEPDGVQTEEKYSTFSLADSIALLKQSRKEMLSYLQSLSEAERHASAIHKTFGAITIEMMLQVILDHDEEHRASIG